MPLPKVWVEPTECHGFTPVGFTHPTTLKSAFPKQALIEGLAAGQLVDLAAYEGIGEGGVAPDEGLGELVDGLLDEAVELVGAELLDQ